MIFKNLFRSGGTSRRSGLLIHRGNPCRSGACLRSQLMWDSSIGLGRRVFEKWCRVSTFGIRNCQKEIVQLNFSRPHPGKKVSTTLSHATRFHSSVYRKARCPTLNRNYGMAEFLTGTIYRQTENSSSSKLLVC